MFLKRLSVFVCCVGLTLGLAAAEEQVPCTRPLKHLNCQDLKDLQERKGCEVEVATCEPIVIEKIVEVEKLVEVPVPVIIEKTVEVEKIVVQPFAVPDCAVCDYVKQWNIQLVGGEKNFRGVQGRYKDFGIRIGQYDINDQPSFASQAVAEVQASTLSSTRSNSDHKTLVCHIPPGNPANQHTISVDQSAVPAHLAHGDYLGACIPVIVDNCSDGVCREDCPQNCDEPPTCNDGVCRAECPQNCDEPPNCSDGVCSEACPQNCDDPPTCDDGICSEACPQNCDDPPSCSDNVCREECPENCDTNPPKARRKLATVEVGRAYTIEGLYFIPLPNRCANFSLYVGAGVTRKTETNVFKEIETGHIFESDKNNRYKATGTIGAEYRLPFSMVVGGGYSSASGFLLHAGYSYRFK